MKRKQRMKKKENESEKDLLIKDTTDANSKTEVNNNRGSMLIKRMDSKISMFAPEASDTDFEDVPVLTICPHCRAKVVTKTGYNKKRPCCLCCCSQDFLFMFKAIHHTCPKCNLHIAKYNRFCFSSTVRVDQKEKEKVKAEQLKKILPSTIEEIDEPVVVTLGEDETKTGGERQLVLVKHEYNISEENRNCGRSDIEASNNVKHIPDKKPKKNRRSTKKKGEK